MTLRFITLRQSLSDFRNKVPSLKILGDYVGRWLAQKTFTTTDRLTFYEDLAFLLDNDIKVEKALTVMLESVGKGNTPMAYCLKDTLIALREGKSVDEGLATWIPRQEAAILSAGSQDGNLAAALYRAITVVQGMAEMKSSIISTMAYPTLLLATTFGMMKMVSIYFLPRLSSLASKEHWSGALWWLSAISEFFVDNAILLSISLIILSIFITWSMSNLTGKTRRYVLDHLMPWSIYRNIAGVAFLLNFSALMRGQIKTEDALEILSRYAPPWLYERLSATQRQVSRGDHLGLALRNAGYGFPSPRAIDKLVLLTDGDNAEVIIENFAKSWLIQTVKQIKKTASRLSLLALCINAGYMILIIMATQNLNDLVGSR
ncbi:type II secretion system F family protein (plasmid) [Yersinia massiliensis]|uniref:type II secretion system F family protein n=1 Tax=Yersinia massiliensis TaxID=419257 RepID=UPI001562E334|nr:type II secretion system F family protein [Yersinia massiliensis]QKJ09427.1 type II secretion system F family protein [Yersinia massiliensis]